MPKQDLTLDEKRRFRISWEPDPEGVYVKRPAKRWVDEFAKRLAKRLRLDAERCVIERSDEKGQQVLADERADTDFLVVLTTEYAMKREASLKAPPVKLPTCLLWLAHLESRANPGEMDLDIWHELKGKAHDGRRFHRVDEADSCSWEDEMKDAVEAINSHSSCVSPSSVCPRHKGVAQAPSQVASRPSAWWRFWNRASK